MAGAKPKGALNVKRRTWDTEDYEAKAKARAAAEEVGAATATKTWKDPANYIDAPEGVERVPGSRRGYLQAPQEAPDLEKHLHQRVVVADTDDGPASTTAFKSKQTGVVVKDSLAYLDHIHGKKHQRTQGLSMRVKASTESDVRSKLAALRQKRSRDSAATKAAGAGARSEVLQEKLAAYEARVAEAQAARAKRPRRGGEQGEEKSNEGASAKSPAGASDARQAPQGQAPAEDDEAAAMAAMMGFSSFAAGKD